MPRMVGLLTSLALKEIRPDLEVVMMAGYGIEEQLRQVLRAGIRDCLTQPVEALEIISNLGIQETNSYTIPEESKEEAGISFL